MDPNKLRDMIDVALRLAIGETEALAQEVGVTRATLHHWRTGQRQPTPDNIRRFATALEARAGELGRLAEALRKEADRKEGG